MFEHPLNLAWLLLLLPLASAAVITLCTRSKPLVSAQISIAAVVLSFITTSILFGCLNHSGDASFPRLSVTWLWIDRFRVDIALRLDRLSLGMALVVTGVASLIHIYSAGYMKGERAYSRYFACMSLFTFSMLGIVLADNLVMMFIFWELVGVSSYLLIGFWYEKATAADACKKAFLCNRVGDFGFLLGILLVFSTRGTLDIAALQNMADQPGLTEHLVTITALLLFCGAVGKSAQFPLHVWLPDAMEGPTPVSALIHAATMVAAGVYMLCRLGFLFNAPALEVVAWIGGITALMAALIAVQQNDIKRILAYSTLSQLGYMVMAVGVGGPAQAMFHLTTHAFFKALLFLGAGSIILAVHHEQNIWQMGNLRRRMPITYWTFMAGTLALCGFPGLSGFYSKDGILAATLRTNHVALFVIGLLAALLTTFYMSRLVIVVFFGKDRSPAAAHAHESPRVMIWPLRILGVLSVIGGAMGIEAFYQLHFNPGEPRVTGVLEQLMAPFGESPLAVAFGFFALVLGFSMSFALYNRSAADPLPERLGWLSRAMRNGFYFDQLYEGLLIPCTQELASWIANVFERVFINGAVFVTSGCTDLFGRALRQVQSGSLQTYAFFFVLGVAAVLYWVLAR